MSFEELLQRRLGPMKDLISSKKRVQAREYDMSQLFFRRADGLELFYHPEASTKQLRVEIPNRPTVTLDFAEVVELVSHHEWISSQQITKTQQKKILEVGTSRLDVFRAK